MSSVTVMRPKSIATVVVSLFGCPGSMPTLAVVIRSSVRSGSISLTDPISVVLPTPKAPTTSTLTDRATVGARCCPEAVRSELAESIENLLQDVLAWQDVRLVVGTDRQVSRVDQVGDHDRHEADGKLQVRSHLCERERAAAQLHELTLHPARRREQRSALHGTDERLRSQRVARRVRTPRGEHVRAHRVVAVLLGVHPLAPCRSVGSWSSWWCLNLRAGARSLLSVGGAVRAGQPIASVPRVRSPIMSTWACICWAINAGSITDSVITARREPSPAPRTKRNPPSNSTMTWRIVSLFPNSLLIPIPRAASPAHAAATLSAMSSGVWSVRTFIRPSEVSTTTCLTPRTPLMSSSIQLLPSVLVMPSACVVIGPPKFRRHRPAVRCCQVSPRTAPRWS